MLLVTPSLGFKQCPLCGMVIPNSDCHTWCLLCLCEACLKECYLICRSFKKRTQVAWDFHLKQHLLEQAMRPELILRPSSGHGLPSGSESTVTSHSRAGTFPKRLRSSPLSSASKKRLHKTDAPGPKTTLLPATRKA